MNTRGLTELIVLNIGLSLGVISPLLFAMLVIMALVTTFMTSPLLEWTYPKDKIREDMLPLVAAAVDRIYRVLVPIANPNTQRDLIGLAVAIAAGDQPIAAHAPIAAAVYPLSVIELNEEYAFESMPAEADRLIADRQAEVNELIDRLEPPDLRSLVYPIVRVASDVAQETVRVASLDQADLILVGWHRPAFSTNRLGGRVGQILSTAQTDVAVFIDRQLTQLEQLLVPYAPDMHNDLSLEIAIRLLVNCPRSRLTILQVRSEPPQNPLSNEFRILLDRLPAAVQARIDMPTVATRDPIAAVVEASATVDLTIAGASRDWGLERQTLGYYADELAVQCHSSLLITRRHRRVTSHLDSIL